MIDEPPNFKVEMFIQDSDLVFLILDDFLDCMEAPPLVGQIEGLKD